MIIVCEIHGGLPIPSESASFIEVYLAAIKYRGIILPYFELIHAFLSLHSLSNIVKYLRL
jgi:hypothetical protein